MIKTASPKSGSFALRTLVIFTCVLIGIANSATCNAQSIVGKWKRTGAKFFVADKATGAQVPVSAQLQEQYDQAAATRGYTELLEFKPDHTYTITVSTAGDAKPTVHDGSYSLSGKDLDMKIPLVNNQKTVITIQTITASTMVWDHIFMNKLTEIIYTKM